MSKDIGGVSVLIAAFLVATGVAVAGYFIGHGLLEARAAQRYVTVKGLSEREMPADQAIWPIVYSVTADDLVTLQQRLDDSAARIVEFLSGDFRAEEISVSVPRVTDHHMQGRPSGMQPAERYSAEASVTLRTGNIETARQAMQRSGELVKAGVALIRSYEYQTSFLFTGLDQIKPEMIAQATRDARRAAEQFAEDSGSRVGSIRNAQQGYFSVEDRDRFSPEFKKIRVVTTVQYFLVDD
jgi:hypothetical protein